MQKWEYMIAVPKGKNVTKEALNKYGAQGWQLTAVYELVLIFKRPLKQLDSPQGDEAKFISICCDRDPCKCGKNDYGPSGRAKIPGSKSYTKSEEDEFRRDLLHFLANEMPYSAWPTRLMYRYMLTPES